MRIWHSFWDISVITQQQDPCWDDWQLYQAPASCILHCVPPTWIWRESFTFSANRVKSVKFSQRDTWWSPPYFSSSVTPQMPRRHGKTGRKEDHGIWRLLRKTSTKNNIGVRQRLSIISIMVSLFMAIIPSYLMITRCLKMLHIEPLNEFKTAITISIWLYK